MSLELIRMCSVFLLLSSCLCIPALFDQKNFGHSLSKRQISTPSFTQSFYSFPLTSCTPGASVGQVFATVYGGYVTTYVISSNSGQFSISSSGLISLNTATPTTETFTVTAYGSSGIPATASVNVISSCSNFGSNFGFGSSSLVSRVPPVFQQSSYAFSVGCSSTQKLQVGLIWATNSRSDTLNYSFLNNASGTPFYVDPNSGLITTYGPVATAGTYSLTAQASDPYGNAVTVPVTITVFGSCFCSGFGACSG